MGIQYTGYPYVPTNDSTINTDSTPASPKPGNAHYVGETQPTSPQVGDIWTSSLGIKRWDGTLWNMYVTGASGSSSLKSGTASFSGSATTVNFSSTFSSIPSVVVTTANSSGSDFGLFVYNVTTSSFAIGAFNMEDGSSKSGSYTVNWIAANQVVSGSTSAGTITGTTNSSGVISVSFGTTYSSAPAVVASWKTLPSSTYEPSFGVSSVTTTGFNIVIYTGEGATTVPAGVAVSLYWIANPAT